MNRNTPEVINGQNGHQIRIYTRTTRVEIPPEPVRFRERCYKVRCEATRAQIGLDKDRRTFLRRAYPTMKHHNPNIPILIREANGIEPKLWARYGR